MTSYQTLPSLQTQVSFGDFPLAAFAPTTDDDRLHLVEHNFPPKGPAQDRALGKLRLGLTPGEYQWVLDDLKAGAKETQDVSDCSSHPGTPVSDPEIIERKRVLFEKIAYILKGPDSATGFWSAPVVFQNIPSLNFVDEASLEQLNSLPEYPSAEYDLAMQTIDVDWNVTEESSNTPEATEYGSLMTQFSAEDLWFPPIHPFEQVAASCNFKNVDEDGGACAATQLTAEALSKVESRPLMISQAGVALEEDFENTSLQGSSSNNDDDPDGPAGNSLMISEIRRKHTLSGRKGAPRSEIDDLSDSLSDMLSIFGSESGDSLLDTGLSIIPSDELTVTADNNIEFTVRVDVDEALFPSSAEKRRNYAWSQCTVDESIDETETVKDTEMSQAVRPHRMSPIKDHLANQPQGWNLNNASPVLVHAENGQTFIDYHFKWNVGSLGMFSLATQRNAERLSLPLVQNRIVVPFAVHVESLDTKTRQTLRVPLNLTIQAHVGAAKVKEHEDVVAKEHADHKRKRSIPSGSIIAY